MSWFLLWYYLDFSINLLWNIKAQLEGYTVINCRHIERTYPQFSYRYSRSWWTITMTHQKKKKMNNYNAHLLGHCLRKVKWGDLETLTWHRLSADVVQSAVFFCLCRLKYAIITIRSCFISFQSMRGLVKVALLCHIVIHEIFTSLKSSALIWCPLKKDCVLAIKIFLDYPKKQQFIRKTIRRCK